MFLPAKKQHGPIAVDVGASAVRAIQFERRGGKLAVRHWWQLPCAVDNGSGPTAPSLATGKAPAGTPATADPALPRIDLQEFIGREVVLSINPPALECAPLRVPDNLLRLEQRALLGAIRHEVSRNVSLQVDEAELDAWRLAPGQMESPNLMVAAARRDAIYRLLNWLDTQGLVCRRMDVGPLAALRACARMAAGPTGTQLWGVLDMGRSAVRLYIGIGEVPVYVRCMSKGCEEMTRRISDELGVARPVAESYKCHYGVQSTEPGHYRRLASADDAVDSRRMSGILLGVLRPIIRGIGEEIQRSFRYAMGLYPDCTVGGLWLIGGGANLSGLCTSLSEMLGIGVQRPGVDNWPIDLVAPAGLSDETVPLMATCLGLGLGEVN